MVKEERPREDSTSWSFACVKIVMAGDGRERGREDLLCHLCKEGEYNKITFVYR